MHERARIGNRSAGPARAADHLEPSPGGATPAACNALRYAPRLAALLPLALLGCGGGGGGGGGGAQPLTGWAAVRAQAAPVMATTDFAAPRVQSIATDGWEDGIFISRDGLHLFAVYAPADLLSFILAGADQNQAAAYLRGPTLGMDLTAPSLGFATWIHGDIVRATRASTAQPFGPWQLSTAATPIFSEGAVVAQAEGAGWGLFAYTSNADATDYQAHIRLARGLAANPTNTGTVLPAPVTVMGGFEDNPHLERLTATDLVLFFDTERAGGEGDLDLWYATSADDGATWSTPVAVATLNEAGKDHQPHLWRDGAGTWWLYWSATDPGDGKLAIWRAQQTTPGDWGAWSARQLVIGAGNTAGVGEPTLTTSGDLSFVVVYQDPAGTATNRYDADPWFAPRAPVGVSMRGR